MVAFLDRPAPVRGAGALGEFAPDTYVVSGQEIYIHYSGGSARSRLKADVIDRRLRVTSTMRNWKTIRKLAELTGA